MKRLLIALMLLVTAGAASAEWTAAGFNDEFIQYVDKATIRRDGNFVKMWDLADFKTVHKSAAGHSFLSQKIQSEYDCKEEKSRILALSRFSGQMGNGKAVYLDSETGKWYPVSPGSMEEILWKIACGKQ